MIPENLFDSIPDQLPDELMQTLWQKNALRIERIVSKGHCTPAGQWYDQEWDEWILLVQGQARLELDNHSMVELINGDYLLLPAHQRHRVDWTAPDSETLWLAIHLQENT